MFVQFEQYQGKSGPSVLLFKGRFFTFGFRGLSPPSPRKLRLRINLRLILTFRFVDGGGRVSACPSKLGRRVSSSW